MFAVSAIRVRHQSVLAVDQHCMDSLAAHLQCSDLGDAAIRVQFTPVEFLEFVAMFRLGHSLITGIFAWRGTGVTCTLNVVLSSQWIDPATFAPKMASDQREITQALDIIHTTDMFGDSQCVIDGGFVCGSIHDGCLLD